MHTATQSRCIPSFACAYASMRAEDPYHSLGSTCCPRHSTVAAPLFSMKVAGLHSEPAWVGRSAWSGQFTQSGDEKAMHPTTSAW
mmetsp:Transcript_28174/g.71832  ORF Transcript_28174/g.71832 Transcript_28174/m.71832 type:complete len:85 (-) Transcript_28174:417-671(-)